MHTVQEGEDLCDIPALLNAPFVALFSKVLKIFLFDLL